MGEFDPLAFQYPAQALAQQVRGLRVGESIKLTDGTVVKSVPMKHGATLVRRFAVSPQGKQPIPREGSASNTYSTSAAAASAALGRRGKK